MALLARKQPQLPTAGPGAYASMALAPEAGAHSGLFRAKAGTRWSATSLTRPKLAVLIFLLWTAVVLVNGALDRSEHPDCQYAWGKADGLHFCGVAHLRLGERELARMRLVAALEIRTRLGMAGGEDSEGAGSDHRLKACATFLYSVGVV